VSLWTLDANWTSKRAVEVTRLEQKPPWCGSGEAGIEPATPRFSVVARGLKAGYGQPHTEKIPLQTRIFEGLVLSASHRTFPGLWTRGGRLGETATVRD
jgi:hypothetical protein